MLITEPGIDWSAVPFHKSSYSTNGGQACVEVGVRRGVVGVRDSKNPAGGVLAVPTTAWALFTDRVRP